MNFIILHLWICSGIISYTSRSNTIFVRKIVIIFLFISLSIHFGCSKELSQGLTPNIEAELEI